MRARLTRPLQCSERSTPRQEHAARSEELMAREYKIGCGVLQGDILSPLLFIIALHYVFKTADPSEISDSLPLPAFQTQLALWVHSLFYADDAALINASAEDASIRLEALQKGLLEMADMLVHWGKTKTMHAQQTIEVAKPAAQEYLQKEATNLLHAKCEGCGESFVNQRGLHVHQRSCELWQRMATEKEWPVERVLEARGTADRRFYYVRWKRGFPQEKKHSWIPAHWCSCSDLLLSRLLEAVGSLSRCRCIARAPNPMLGETQDYVHRCCSRCNHFFKSDAARIRATRPSRSGSVVAR